MYLCGLWVSVPLGLSVFTPESRLCKPVCGVLPVHLPGTWKVHICTSCVAASVCASHVHACVRVYAPACGRETARRGGFCPDPMALSSVQM